MPMTSNVAGFGISADDDLLYVEDFVSVKQTVTVVTVELRVSELLAQQSSLTALLRRITRARQRGWHLTANRLRVDLPYELRSVTNCCHDLEQTCAPQNDPVIPLQLILDELRLTRATMTNQYICPFLGGARGG